MTDEEPDAEKDTYPVPRGVGVQLKYGTECTKSPPRKQAVRDGSFL